MNNVSTMKRLLSMSQSVMYTLIIALMFSFGLSTAQAKDRISYFHNDLSGSPIAASNESGELLWEETYKPFGERLNNPNTQNKHWFGGKQEEADLGLQYFGARWYHQDTGRFISRDPEGALAHVENNPMMFNRYAYANNNPYLYVDTDGRLPFLIPVAIFIAKEIASEAVEQTVGVPMPTVKNGLKFAIKQANKQIAKEGMEQAAKVAKKASKKGKRKGRSGKQARLREIMNDPKASSADRGWLKNDARHVKYGNKPGLRVPRNGRKSPGRKSKDKGYELAHPYNAPASKGNNYAGSKLKNYADHKVETRLQKHRY